MGRSAIEWTDETDNIITVEGGGWWCRKCSEGCDNCYAEGVNDMNYFKGNHLKYSGAAPQLKLKTDIIDGWARQRRPRRHFVASMTDVFGEWVPQEWINRYLDGMTAAPLQTFQVLTKRARRMRKLVNEWLVDRGLQRVPVNIHLGVSVENQKWADTRIPDLVVIPCDVHFLSVEPLLGPIDLHLDKIHNSDESEGIQWVIVGGESGKNARPMDPDWVRDLRDECVRAGVPFFFKQWGQHAPNYDVMPGNDYHVIRDPMVKAVMSDCGKKAAGRLLDGRTWDEFPREGKVAA